MKKKELSELQRGFNEYFNGCDEEYLFKLSSNKESITLMCNMGEDDDFEELFKLEVNNVNNYEELFKALISALYDGYINPTNKIVKNWKSFTTTKIKSMEYWMAKNNTEKVNLINESLIERYKLMIAAKSEVDFLKRFISMFYILKEEYCVKEAM